MEKIGINNITHLWICIKIGRNDITHLWICIVVINLYEKTLLGKKPQASSTLHVLDIP